MNGEVMGRNENKEAKNLLGRRCRRYSEKLA